MRCTRLVHRRTGFAAIVILLALSSGLHSAEPPRWDFSALLRRTCRFERLYEVPGHRVGMASSHDRTLANGDTGAIKRFVNDHHNVTGYHQALVELDGQSSVLARMVYGLDLVKMSRSGEYYYIYDPLGSTRALTDYQAAVTDTYAYDAYGNIIEQDPQPPNGTENAYLFTGDRLDAFTGFYYLRARFYDPATGRFTQLDTFLGSSQDPLSLHRYLYANANPIGNVDPSGHFSVAELGVTMGTGALIGGVISGGISYAIKRDVDEAIHDALIGAAIGALTAGVGYGVQAVLFGRTVTIGVLTAEEAIAVGGQHGVRYAWQRAQVYVARLLVKRGHKILHRALRFEVHNVGGKVASSEVDILTDLLLAEVKNIRWASYKPFTLGKMLEKWVNQAKAYRALLDAEPELIGHQIKFYITRGGPKEFVKELKNKLRPILGKVDIEWIPFVN